MPHGDYEMFMMRAFLAGRIIASYTLDHALIMLFHFSMNSIKRVLLASQDGQYVFRNKVEWL